MKVEIDATCDPLSLTIPLKPISSSAAQQEKDYVVSGMLMTKSMTMLVDEIPVSGLAFLDTGAQRSFISSDSQKILDSKQL
jgi:hypothetical protein